MSVSYKCPNADCGVTLNTPTPVPAGKRVKCPKCTQMFAPVPESNGAAPAAGTFKFADDQAKKPAPAAAPPPAPKPHKKPEEEEESNESIKKGYGVVQESQEELEKAEEAKVKFEKVEDKYKKSARGPAIALLVMPANLLTAEGLLTCVFALVVFVTGMWPLAFNDAPPSEEETEEAIMQMLLGCLMFFWGSMICFGASKMAELGSYLWAMMGAVLGVLPLLVGIYAIIMLQNPKVKEGFEESDAGVEDEDEEELKKKDDDDDEEEEDDDHDEDDEPRKKRRR